MSPARPAYRTLSEALTGLRARGFTADFNLAPDALLCEGCPWGPEDFEIREFHRFEGASDPADEAIVYAIEARKGPKGVLVNGYGPTADSLSATLADKLRIHRG